MHRRRNPPIKDRPAMQIQLTQAQRYTIFVLKQKKWTNKSIAEAINVHPSTVSRELHRNSMANGVYYYEKAEKLARSRRNSVPGNRSISPAARMVARDLILTEDRSPKQVSGYLKREKGISISHETIYKMIREDATGELAGHCCHKMRYKKKKKRRRETKATNIRNRVSIHERPAEADGTRFGDYETTSSLTRAATQSLSLSRGAQTSFSWQSSSRAGKPCRRPRM